ncbi:hypothetical protein [Nocardiopsis sp. FR4]|uniref:hypothetical protein n=1 Tax=Nocardiopsis sp. FR4 TaxID=2605985 RepID=UPI00135B4D34|nr:hypothetical protein [Nocardiopsis sp. FR4]
MGEHGHQHAAVALLLGLGVGPRLARGGRGLLPVRLLRLSRLPVPRLLGLCVTVRLRLAVGLLLTVLRGVALVGAGGLGVPRLGSGGLPVAGLRGVGRLRPGRLPPVGPRLSVPRLLGLLGGTLRRRETGLLRLSRLPVPRLRVTVLLGLALLLAVVLRGLLRLAVPPRLAVPLRLALVGAGGLGVPRLGSGGLPVAGLAAGGVLLLLSVAGLRGVGRLRPGRLPPVSGLGARGLAGLPAVVRPLSSLLRCLPPVVRLLVLLGVLRGRWVRRGLAHAFPWLR